MIKFVPWFTWQVPLDVYLTRGYERIVAQA